MKISRVKLHEGVQCGPDFKTFLTGDNYDITFEEVSGVHFMKVCKPSTGDVSYVSTINIIWFTMEEEKKQEQVKSKNIAPTTSKKSPSRTSKKKPSSKAKL